MSPRLPASLPTTILLLHLAVAVGAQEPATAPARPRSAELLLQAISHYQRSEFDDSRRLLLEVVRLHPGESSRLVQEAYTYLAFVQIAFNETEAAVEAFERALSIQPDLSLGSTSPRIAAALAEARRRHRAKIRALDHDPPRQLHQPALRVRHATPLTIVDEVSDVSGVKRVVLNYRIAGNRGYASVTMERDARGRYVASIPAPSVVRPAVEYYLEAWDALGNGPGLKGSPALPIRVEVEGGPLASAEEPRAAPTPWYKRWWVWASVAGAVAIAGGAATAAYFTRSETALINLRVSAKEVNP